MNADKQTAVAKFAAEIQVLNMTPGWQLFGDYMPKLPKPSIVPAHWRYQDALPYLLKATELVNEHEAERRVLTFENPGMPRQARITRSLTCGLQVVLPGETARAHRHAANALRFVVDGEGAIAHTTVNGARADMLPGDLLLTPGGSWHDHHCSGDRYMVWLDGLDLHLVNQLDAPYFEVYPEIQQPVSKDGRSFAEAGHNMLPIGRPLPTGHSPICRYPYANSRAALHDRARASDPDPWHAYKMKYANPVTGDWALPTIATSLQLLPQAFSTRPYRSTESAVFVVVEGSGVSKIGDKTFEWSKNDIFVAPSWVFQQHTAHTEAVLFSYSERAAQEKLQLFREQRLWSL